MKIVKNIITILTILQCLLLQSCATVFNSGSQYIGAEPSNQIGDKLPIRVETTYGAYVSKLPTTIVTRPSSFDDVIIELKAPCFVEQRIKVTKSVTPSFWVNILFGLVMPIPMLIDYYSGYMWRLDKNIIVPIEKKENCSRPKKSAIEN